MYKIYFGGNCAWPIIYFIIFRFKVREYFFENIGKILEITYYIGILFLIILYINFNYFQILDIKFIVNYFKIERPGQYTKSTGFIAAITPMIFSSCYLLSKSFHEYLEKKSFKVYFLLLVNFIFIIVTMRKILVILYPIIILFNYFMLKKNYNKKIIKNIIFGIALCLLINNFQIINLNNFSNYIFKSYNYFSSEKYSGVNERKQQFYSLLEGIKKSPFIGEGIGADVEVKRSSVVGAYELTYIAKIFQMGILGFSLWIFMIAFLLKKALYESRNKKIIKYYISGTVSILVVNASNPYLGSFEFDWMLYILLFLINNYSKKGKSVKL
ncbi:MAG: hypothetical protein ACRC0G_03860 [Fusobacteriaceae bacterium]